MRRLAPRRPAARFSTAHGQHQHPHEAPKAPAAPLTPQEFCRQIVQQRDRDHYACTLFLPKKSQDAVFAVRALNVELASLRDVAKQGPARIGRVQFWRHLVDETYKPIAKALAAAVKDHQLTKGWVLRILDSREKDLNDRIPLKIEDAESYAEGTQSALLYLTLESCGVKNVNADHAASHIGKAYGLVNLLRALPFTAAQRQTYLPLSLLNKARGADVVPAADSQTQHKVMMEDVFRGKNSPELQNVVWDLASNANVHLEHARSLRKTVPVVRILFHTRSSSHAHKAARSALLSGVIAGQWLSRLQKCDFDVFHPSLRTPDPWQFARLYWAHIRANY